MSFEEWQRKEEELQFRAMVRSRARFELMVGSDPEEVTPRQMAEAWRLSHADPNPPPLTDDEYRALKGSARYL